MPRPDNAKNIKSGTKGMDPDIVSINMIDCEFGEWNSVSFLI
jgi:hypothetical protein